MRWLKDYQDRCAKEGGKRPVGPGRLLLQWHITDRCNLRCSHCYQETYGGPELGFRQLLEIVDQYRELLAVKGARRGHINVTGGEPFMREDFLPFLEVLANHREAFSFAILCNGNFLTGKAASHLKALKPDFVQVSLEGGKAAHDRIRGRGDFDRVMEGLTHLRREKITTYISFTAHKDNYRDFLDAAEAGIRLGVAKVWADRLIPTGGGAAMAGKTLSPEETREFFAIMEKARDRAERSWFGRTEIGMGRALQFLAGGGEPYCCGAGDSLLALASDGTLYPCRRMPVPIGNVMTTPLAGLYTGSGFLRSLRERGRLAEGCGECFYRKVCRGGLRCLSYALTGSPFRADPGCWLARQEGETASDRPGGEREPLVSGL